MNLLLEKGYQVRVLDNLQPRVHPRGKPPWLPKVVELIQGDVTNRADLQRALEGVDYIFHMAAYQDYMTDFSTFFHVNSVGTALLYEVVVERRLPIQKVILASSQAVYGEGKYRCSNSTCAVGSNGGVCYPDSRSEEQLKRGEWEHKCPACGAALKPQLTDETRANPQNPYALSKYSQELIALSLGKRYGIPTVAMRYSIVQGPRQSFYNAYSGACRVFCLSLYFDRDPLIYEDGLQLRDYVNIRDVVDANILVLGKSEADYQVFNVGGGRAYTVLELANIVARIFGKDSKPKIAGVYRFGDTRHILSDISKLQSLGWSPKHTPEDSVRDYVAWLHQQENVEDILGCTQQHMRDLAVIRSVMR